MDIIRLEQSVEGMGYFGINWALTTVCNYRCSYCHPDLHNGKIKPPALEDILRFTEHLFSYCDARGIKPYFEFGGGEVTYLAWFSKLLAAIHRRGGLVSIISNASSPLVWWQKHLPMLHSVSLSYHHEEIKSSRHFIAVAQQIAASPTSHLQVNVMMLPTYFEGCLRFAEQLRQQVDCSISLQPLYHGFGGGGISGRYEYTEQQESIMAAFGGQPSKKAIPNPRGLMTVVAADGTQVRKSSFELLVNQQTHFSGWHCHAGLENIIVTFEGDIYRAWCMQDAPLGSLYDEVLHLPTKATLCHTKICQCGPDICSSKSRVA